MVGKKKAYKIENLAPTTGVAGAKRVKLIYGPYTLKAANVWRNLKLVSLLILTNVNRVQ